MATQPPEIITRGGVGQYKCLCLVFACFIESMTRNIADDNSCCCDCRECKETYARRSKLARHLNVSDGVSTRRHAENVTHGPNVTSMQYHGDIG